MDAKEMWIKKYGHHNSRVDDITAIKFANEYHQHRLDEENSFEEHTHIPIAGGKGHVTWHGDNPPTEKQMEAFEKMAELAINHMPEEKTELVYVPVKKHLNIANDLYDRMMEADEAIDAMVRKDGVLIGRDDVITLMLRMGVSMLKPTQQSVITEEEIVQLKHSSEIRHYIINNMGLHPGDHGVSELFRLIAKAIAALYKTEK